MCEVDLRKLPPRLGPSQAWDVRSWDLTERERLETTNLRRNSLQGSGSSGQGHANAHGSRHRWPAVPRGPRRGEDTEARPVSSAPGSHPLPPRPPHGASCGA